MSQFDSLSKDFRDSLVEMADGIRQRSEDAQQKEAAKPDEISPLGYAFVDSFLKPWYEGLDDDSKAEVRRAFAEVGQLKLEHVLSVMKVDRRATPMGLLDGMFIVTDDPPKQEDATPEDKNTVTES